MRFSDIINVNAGVECIHSPIFVFTYNIKIHLCSVKREFNTCAESIDLGLWKAIKQKPPSFLPSFFQFLPSNLSYLPFLHPLPPLPFSSLSSFPFLSFTFLPFLSFPFLYFPFLLFSFLFVRSFLSLFLRFFLLFLSFPSFLFLSLPSFLPPFLPFFLPLSLLFFLLFFPIP